VNESGPGTGSIAAGAFTDNGMHECQDLMWEEPKLWTINATRNSQRWPDPKSVCACVWLNLATNPSRTCLGHMMNRNIKIS